MKNQKKCNICKTTQDKNLFLGLSNTCKPCYASVRRVKTGSGKYQKAMVNTKEVAHQCFLGNFNAVPPMYHSLIHDNNRLLAEMSGL